jgi:hypothetical protein
MIYSVKVEIFAQKDANAGQIVSGSGLPVVLVSELINKTIADVLVPGTGSLTPTALKTRLRSDFDLTSPISESLSIGGNVVSGSAPITARILQYCATIPAPVVG